ncbi:MAG: hypothetical protein WD942_05085 [Dehalococcoidia bacterium]
MNTDTDPNPANLTSRDRATEQPAAPPDPAALLDAQCWLWGQDLRSPNGNLLVQFGLTRGVFPGEGDHRTYYQGVTAIGCTVVAWSGGVLLGDSEASLFLPRSRFTPLMLPGLWADDAPPDLRGVMNRSHLSAPADHPHVISALRWLVRYERFVLDHGATGWRAECARRWEQVENDAHRVAAEVGIEYERLAPLPTDGLARAWERLAAGATATAAHHREQSRSAAPLTRPTG